MTPAVIGALGTAIVPVLKPLVKLLGDHMAKSKRPFIRGLVTFFRRGK